MQATHRNDVKRETRLYVAGVNHPAAKIFPLLCPTREYDWIAIWDCELLYSRSGVAELDCVFQTKILDQNHISTWMVDIYQPNEKIQFSIFAEGCIMRYAITLHEKPDGTTTMPCYMTITAFNAAGYHYLEENSAEHFEHRMKGIEAMLNHYLDTGEMLQLESHE